LVEPVTHSGPVLLVDDEPDARYLISSVLRQEGYEVEMASDRAEAIRFVTSHRPALVLLDWRLPGDSGDRVAEAIRLHHPDTAFVVVTADGRASSKAEEIHARGHLQKPFQVEELVEVVAEVLGH
jgi:CheY-like chemotaxis protein